MAHDAQALLEKGQIAEAVTVAESAAAAGDSKALFLLATWYLAAYPVSRDVEWALELLRRATEIGHVDAAVMRIALIANGATCAPDWAGALDLQRNAARDDPLAALQLELVLKMALGRNGDPSGQYERTSIGPEGRIWLLPDLLTPAESIYIAHKAAPMLAPSQIADPVDGTLRPHPVRNSLDAVIGPAREDIVIAAINRRIASVSETCIVQGEPLTILNYPIGGQYRPHLDALPDGENIRIRTVLIYLNDNFTGGETHFPVQNICIKPKAGMGVMFDNYRSDGKPDPSSLHAGLPVTNGTKWVASRWIRKYPLDLWACRPNDE